MWTDERGRGICLTIFRGVPRSVRPPVFHVYPYHLPEYREPLTLSLKGRGVELAHSGRLGFAEVKEAHEGVVAVMIQGAGPTGGLAGGGLVLKEVEAQERRDAVAFVVEIGPGDRDLAAPGRAVERGGVVNAGAFEGKPGRRAAGRSGLSLGPLAAAGFEDEVRDRADGVVHVDRLDQ